MKAANLFGTLTAFVILFYSAILLPKLNFILLQGNVKPIIVLAFLLLFFLLNSFKKKQAHFSFGNIDVLFLSITALQGISALWAINYLEAINVATNWATLYVVFKFFQQVCLNHQTKKHIILIFTFFCCTSILIACVVVLVNGFSNQTNFFFDNSANSLLETYQLTKTYISMLFVLFWGVAIFLMVQKKERTQWFGVLLFLLIYLIVILLQSRGSMLLAVVLLFILSASNFYLKSISWFKVSSLIVLSIALFYTAGFLRSNTPDYLYLMDPLYGIKRVGGDDRLTLWKMSYQLFLEKPLLGYGSGNWLYEYMRFDFCNLSKVNYSTKYFIHPHNMFIEKLVENGILGFLLSAVFFIVYPFWCLLQKLKNKTFNNYDYLWFPGILCFMANLMLYGTLQIGWGNFKGQVFLYLLFLSQFLPKKTILKPSYNKIINQAILATTIFLLAYYINTGYLSHHFLKCSNYFKRNNISLAEKHLNILEQNFMEYQHKGISTENLRMRFYYKNEQYLQAEKSMLKQLKQHPYNFNFWFQLGNILAKQYKFAEAKNAYQKALLYNCEFIPAQIKLLNLGFVLNDEEKINEMRHQLSPVDTYLAFYKQNEAAHSKIKKAVRQKKIFQYFKAQRDSILNANNVR